MRNILLIIVFFLIIFLSVISIYSNLVPFPRYKVNVDFDISTTTFDEQDGRKLILTTCFQCHYNKEHHALSGRMHGNPKRLGDFYSSNITNDTLTGIGTWSKEDLYFFFRTGIKKDGNVAFDMPKYPLLSEKDLGALIAFLKSDDPLVKPTKHHIPKPSYSLITKVYKHFFLKPEKLPSKSIEHTDTSNYFEFGRYLVNAKYSCFDCHSKNSITNNYSFPEKSLGYLKGGNRHANENREIIYTPSIINISNKDYLSYSENEFYKLLVYGIKKNGYPVKDPMFPYSVLNRREVNAIFKYLNNCCDE
jgi:hypothetical protein